MEVALRAAIFRRRRKASEIRAAVDITEGGFSMLDMISKMGKRLKEVVIL